MGYVVHGSVGVGTTGGDTGDHVSAAKATG